MGKSTNIRLEDGIGSYLIRMESLGMAESTVRVTREALERWLRWFPGNPYVHTITEDQMEDYFYRSKTGLKRQPPLKSNTFNRYRASIDGFWNHAVERGWVDVSPMRFIKPARPDTPLPHILLSATELEALLDNARDPVHRIAMSLAMNTGMRSNDLTQLKVFDVNLNNGTIQTEIRKTRKLDVKPITMDLENDLIWWLNLYADVTGYDNRSQLPNDFYLLPVAGYWDDDSRRGLSRPRQFDPRRPITKPFRIVKYALTELGYPTYGEGMHTLRRSSARALFESLRESGEGRDHALMIVKDYLNHSSTGITEHYLGLKEERAIRDSILKGKPFLSRLAAEEQQRLGGDNDGRGDSSTVRHLRQDAG